MCIEASHQPSTALRYWPFRAIPLAIREGQSEGGHLVVIANQHNIADQRRMVPSLALERREPRELSELVGRRLYQHQLSLLRQHQQQS